MDPKKAHWTDSEIEAASAFDFTDLQPQEVPVKYLGKDYILREASADAAAKYRNAQLKATKLQDGKPVSIDGMADADPLLLAQCLVSLEPTDKPGGKEYRPVHISLVRGMPHRVAKPLVQKLKQISGLNDDESVESLEKQKKDLEQKIAKLKAEKGVKDGTTDEAGGGDSGPKELPGTTTDSSE